MWAASLLSGIGRTDIVWDGSRRVGLCGGGSLIWHLTPAYLGNLQAGLGASPAFRVPEYELQSVWELPLVLALGALCGLASAAFKASSRVQPASLDRLPCVDVFHHLPSPKAASMELPATIGNLCHEPNTGLLAQCWPIS